MISLLSYSTTNVTSGGYVQLVASTPVSTSNLLVVDTSTQLMKLATGSAGHEVDLCVFQGNGSPVSIPTYLPQGTRLSLRAISTSASAGSNAVSYL